MTLDNKNIASLDGIRGYSILLVLLSHFGLGNIVPGGLGVTIFFFISGFLITKLLMYELVQTTTIHFKDFYLRRIFRLYPALIFFLLLVVGLFVVLNRHIEVSEVFASLFYYMNYNEVYFRSEKIDQLHGVLNILWSLSIEEHFYLIFPVSLFYLYKREKLFYIFSISIFILCLIFRLYYSQNLPTIELIQAYNYSLTHTRIDSIMYGCLTAFLLYGNFGDRMLILFRNNILSILSGLVLIFTIIYRDPIFRETFRYSLQGIALSFIIVNLMFSKSRLLLILLSNKYIVLLGRLSYSVYLFHWFSIYVGSSLFEKFSLPWYIIVIPLSFGISFMSYYYVEKPFIQLRKKYGSNV